MAKKISAHFQKRASSVLDYKIDWVTWLNADTIATSTWSVPTGITSSSNTYTTTATTIWLSGGTIGSTYEITNTITTAGGRTDYRTLSVEVIE